MEKIEIKDFAGIKDIKLEIRSINILIGPQASGKSTIAKLIYYFKNFIFEIISAAKETKTAIEIKRDYTRKFKEFFPSSSWGNQNFKIIYYIDEKFIEISRKRTKSNRKSSEVILKYSDFYKKILDALRNFIKKYKQEIPDQESPLMIYNLEIYRNTTRQSLTYISEVLSKIAAFSQLYIPAGRSFFANLKSSTFTFLSKNNSIDPFLVEFGTYYELAKSPTRRSLLSDQAKEQKLLFDEISTLNKRIICGKYLQKNGEDYLELEENRQISVANSSSGQQETLPIAVILGTLAFSNSKVGGNSIYIEEPEAHIFPGAQRDIVELIATVYNAQKGNLQFFITTHSPYILTAFNNLLQAGILAVDASEEKIEKISAHVPKTRFINPQEVAVYSLKNGYCESIIDEETGLINTNIIDEVSNELAIQFDELLDLEE